MRGGGRFAKKNLREYAGEGKGDIMRAVAKKIWGGGKAGEVKEDKMGGGGCEKN